MATQPQYRFMERFSVEARQAALVDYVPGVYDNETMKFVPDHDGTSDVEDTVWRYPGPDTCYCPLGLIFLHESFHWSHIWATPSADDVVDLLNERFGDLEPGESDEIQRFIDRFDAGYYGTRPMLACALGLADDAAPGGA